MTDAKLVLIPPPSLVKPKPKGLSPLRYRVIDLCCTKHLGATLEVVGTTYTCPVCGDGFSVEKRETVVDGLERTVVRLGEADG